MFVFDCFDINHDRYLCQNDAWKVMEYDTTSRYGEDISLIVEQFKSKKQYEKRKKDAGARGNARSERRRMDAVRTQPTFAEKNKSRKKDIPPRFNVAPIQPNNKPEALTLKDFLEIKF